MESKGSTLALLEPFPYIPATSTCQHVMKLLEQSTGGANLLNHQRQRNEQS